MPDMLYAFADWIFSLLLTLLAPYVSTSVTAFLLLDFFPEHLGLQPLAFSSSIPLPAQGETSAAAAQLFQEDGGL